MTSVTGSVGNLKYRLAYQTAGTMVQQPNAWTDLELAFSQPNTSYEERNTGELAITTTDMWFRLGVGFQSAAAVDINITAVLDACCACR